MIDDNARLAFMVGMMLGLIALIIWGPNYFDGNDDE